MGTSQPLKITKPKFITLTCAGCGTTFERAYGKVATAMSYGKKTFYCSGTCSTRYAKQRFVRATTQQNYERY